MRSQFARRGVTPNKKEARASRSPEATREIQSPQNLTPET